MVLFLASLKSAYLFDTLNLAFFCVPGKLDLFYILDLDIFDYFDGCKNKEIGDER